MTFISYHLFNRFQVLLQLLPHLCEFIVNWVGVLREVIAAVMLKSIKKLVHQ